MAVHKYILDTSVTAKLFLENEEQRDIALEVFRQAHAGKIQLFVPTLTWYELSNVFVKIGLPQDEIQSHLSMFQKQVDYGVITVIPHSQELLNKAVELVQVCTIGKSRPSAYDCTFHALALLEEAVFLTADQRHYKKTIENIGSVLLLADFQ